MSSSAAVSKCVVLLLLVQAVQSEQGCWGVNYTQTNICASNGSTVEMHCTYKYPDNHIVTKTFWCFSGTEDLKEYAEYKYRTEYTCNASSCTMKIADLRQEDSREYKFRFITNKSGGKFTGTPGIALSVTALQVEMTKIRGNESYTKAEVKCKSSCSGDAAYVWLKNGVKVAEENPYTAHLHPNDSICCALKGQKNYSSASLYPPKPPSVTVSPPGEIMEGSAVTLICSSDFKPAAKHTWHREDGQILINEKKLDIPSIQSYDSGLYYCTAENELGIMTSKHLSIDVKYAPKFSSVSVSPSGEIAKGMSVILNCSSDANPAPNYTWSKENQSLPAGSEGLYHFTPISPEDRGSYSCKSENQYGHISSSPVFINVQYAPKRPSVSVSPSGEIVEGSSVTLTCSSDANPAANYTWYKNGEESPKALGQNFTIANFSPEHTGTYQCEVQNSRGRHSSTVYLTIVQLSGNDSEKWKVIGGTVFAVVLVIIFIWILTWKKWIHQKFPVPTESPGNIAQKQPAEQKSSLHYASIQFSKKQADPLYSNIRPAQSQKHKEEDENKVQYDVVMFKSASSAPSNRSQEIGQDPSTLYSSINRALQKDANQR